MVWWRGIFSVVLFVPFLGVACADDSGEPGSSAGSGGSPVGGKGGQGGAGRGGSASGTSGRGGGTSGRGGGTSVGGEGGDAGALSGAGAGAGGWGGESGAGSCTCDDDDCTETKALDAFCPFGSGECPTTLEHAQNPEIYETDITSALYSECASGRVAFDWLVFYENHYRLVFDEGNGSLVYGSFIGHVGEACGEQPDGGVWLQAEAGGEVSLSDCSSCDFVAALPGNSGAGGAGGESGSGSGGAGAGGENNGDMPPCVIDENGRISLPE
jgi:hypothetical protein